VQLFLVPRIFVELHLRLSPVCAECNVCYGVTGNRFKRAHAEGVSHLVRASRGHRLCGSDGDENKTALYGRPFEPEAPRKTMSQRRSPDFRDEFFFH
jgi:hypothetical protein